ncbi:MAG: class I SAM-dependent RNA methyltransferase [Planctomycetaceae bacterium]|nr:class I SAM-dependent RNA methyltransferase [Planctomycetaceae bacterium]
MNTDNLQLIATAAFGLEAVVARELKQLGYEDTRIEDGRVHFTGDARAICRTNLWLRSADRVLIRVADYVARDFDQLFEGAQSVNWADWLTEDACFPVRGKSVRSQLHSVPSCQAMVKKAIVEQLKQKYPVEWFEETGPEVPIEISLRNDQATLTLDTTGAGLHKRGYRVRSTLSPLKETLAAGLVQLSVWNPQRPLFDPCCGSGTIPIEAALIALNRAPGLGRSFTAEDWPGFPATAWEEARTEARDLAISPDTRDAAQGELFAADIDPAAVSATCENAASAGVSPLIQTEVADARSMQCRRKYGCLITNPPYGERSSSPEEAEALHEDLAEVFARHETWSFFVLTTHPAFERLIGRRAERRRKLYNARIACTYYQMLGPRPPWQQRRPEQTQQAE